MMSPRKCPSQGKILSLVHIPLKKLNFPTKSEQYISFQQSYVKVSHISLYWAQLFYVILGIKETRGAPGTATSSSSLHCVALLTHCPAALVPGLLSSPCHHGRSTVMRQRDDGQQWQSVKPGLNSKSATYQLSVLELNVIFIKCSIQCLVHKCSINNSCCCCCYYILANVHRHTLSRAQAGSKSVQENERDEGT